MEDVDTIFQPKKRPRKVSESSEVKTLDELLKKNKKVDEAATSMSNASDSGQASNTTSSPAVDISGSKEDFEELSDMELFMSDDDDVFFDPIVVKKEETKILDDCEIISSDEEW